LFDEVALIGAVKHWPETAFEELWSGKALSAMGGGLERDFWLECLVKGV
jgi:hypothetical protein